MTLVEQLKAHEGGLIRLKTQLWWYHHRDHLGRLSRGWDRRPGRVCVLLNVHWWGEEAPPSAAFTPATAWPAAFTPATVATAFLLFDDSPHWVRVAKEDVELLNAAR